jgi:hypothetical protein
MAQRQLKTEIETEVSAADALRATATEAFNALQSAVTASVEPLAAAKDAKANVKTCERAYLWASAAYIVLLNDPDSRKEAAHAVADEVARVRGLGDGTRDNYRSRMTWATSPDWADVVMATSDEKRAKADPMSTVLKLMRAAEEEAAERAAEAGRIAEARQHGAEALRLLARRKPDVPADQIAADVMSGDAAANAEFSAAVTEVQSRHELMMRFGDWQDRQALRAWLSETAEADAKADADAKEAAEKLRLSQEGALARMKEAAAKPQIEALPPEGAEEDDA